MLCQPLSHTQNVSPNTNVSYLRFFNAIQLLQQQSACKTVDESINAVEKSFFESNSNTFNKVLLSCQQRIVETMKINEANNYKVR